MTQRYMATPVSEPPSFKPDMVRVKPGCWGRLTKLETRIIEVVNEYQNVSMTWKEYLDEFPGVQHQALEYLLKLEGMDPEDFNESITWMINDPDIPLYETSMSTPEDRRYEHRW